MQEITMESAALVSHALFHVRRTLLVLAAAIYFLGSPSPALPAGGAGPQSDQTVHVKTVVIAVQGMVCFACAGSVKRALKSIDGVWNVEVSLEKQAAKVTYAPDKLSPDRLVAAINKAGYGAGAPKEVE
jgi:copper chaperone CopZ